jgi:hypothetical protein
MRYYRIWHNTPDYEDGGYDGTGHAQTFSEDMRPDVVLFDGDGEHVLVRSTHKYCGFTGSEFWRVGKYKHVDK